MSVWPIHANLHFCFGFSHKIFQVIKAKYFNLIIEFESESQGEKKEG